MNFKIRMMRDSIVKLINEAELPIEVIRLVLIEIMAEVDKQAEKQILEEANNQNKNQKEEMEESEYAVH